MSKRKADETNSLPHGWETWAKEYFTHCPIVPLDQFERDMIAHYPEMAEVPGKTGAGRERRLNLVDHAKAQLTKGNRTYTMSFGGRAFLIWVGMVGAVNPHGHLVPEEHLRSVLIHLAQHLEPEKPQ